MTPDKAFTRISTLSNDNSQESAPSLSIDKTWHKCTKKVLTK